MTARLLALLLALAALAGPARALDPSELLADPTQEARARALSKELRCLVCQNESIDDSNADLARDLRRIVRQRIAGGDSDAGIKDYLVQRYGDFVLLEPPVKAKTWALWFGPALVLAVGALGVLVFFRRRTTAAGPAPLSAEELRRVEQLLGEESKR